MTTKFSAMSIFHVLYQMWCQLKVRRHKQFLLLLGLTVLSALAEIVSLGAVLPFLGIITQPEKIFSLSILSPFIKFLEISSHEELILPLAVAFALAAILAGVLRLFLLWFSINLTNAIGADLAFEVYRRTLYQPYAVHISRSTSEIISGVTQKVSITTNVLMAVVNIVTSTILFLMIIITLIIIDPIVAILSVITFGAVYASIAIFTRRQLANNSYCIAHEQTYVIKSLQDGLGSIRDVLVDGTQEIYCGVYHNALLKLQRATGQNNFICLSPRYGMEALGMVLIAIFVITLSQGEGGVAAILPVMGVLALGAQRLLPLMQQLYGGWSTVLGSKAALNDVLMLLEQKMHDQDANQLNEPLTLKNKIDFDDVSFRYTKNGPLVLNQVNLSISKGERVGIIGGTGSGKSTALDLLMGLLDPTQGRILIDGVCINEHNKRGWQSTIAHVPQTIFLTDGTIAENIAFGIPKERIDFDLVRKAAQEAQIAEFIQNRVCGYDSLVGERGVRLSGGQRQRIAIARAMYKQAKVLIFDEATSALDSETEIAIMQTIDRVGKDITVLMIAHRITTLKNCSKIVELNGGQISRVCSYDDLFLNKDNS